jgi:dihydrolipoamide dehydrogenase
VALAWRGGSTGEARFRYVLAAAGRPPRLAGLGLDTTGLALDAHGLPALDPATLQCGSAPIFMAGDADHARPVLHEAQAEGTIAGRNAATFPKVTPGRRMTPLSIMFTDPAMAVVGTPPRGEAAGVVCGSAGYADQGRARMFGTNAGLARIYARADDGRLTGAVMAGPGIEHSAHLIAWAIQRQLTADDLLDLPFYHPTYEEGLKPALRQICRAAGRAVPADRDDGFVPGA